MEKPKTPVPIDVENRHRPGRPAGSGGGPMGASGSRSVPNYVVGPPTVERPPNATDFFISPTLTGITLGSGPTVFGDTFEVPKNNVAVIRSVSILANGLLITSDLLWTLRFNEVAVTGWNRLTINPRAAGSIEVSFVPEETFIPVPEGAIISWLFRVLDGGTYQVSVNTHGWFYPMTTQMLAAKAYG